MVRAPSRTVARSASPATAKSSKVWTVLALAVMGALASVPLVIIGGFFALASDAAAYYMTAVLVTVPALGLWVTRRPRLRAVAAGVVVGGLVFAAWMMIPVAPDPGPVQTEAKLRAIASGAPEPIYYVGSSFQGQPLGDAFIFTGGEEAVGDDTLDPGQSIDVSYGEVCEQDTCSSIVDITTDRPPWILPEGCTPMRPLRGVPTVRLPEEVLLFTGDVIVHLRGPHTAPDLAQATATAASLRAVGQPEATGQDLPLPGAAPSSC